MEIHLGNRRNSMALRSVRMHKSDMKNSYKCCGYCIPSRPCLAALDRPMSDEYERRRVAVLNEIQWGLSYGA